MSKIYSKFIVDKIKLKAETVRKSSNDLSSYLIHNGLNICLSIFSLTMTN